MQSFTPTEIQRLKREAKRLQRADSIRLAQALDRVAVARGYKNWSLLMKHRPSDAIERQPHTFVRSIEAFKEALRVVRPPRFARGEDVARARVAEICAAFVSPLNAVEFAIAYMEALLALPRYRVAANTQAQWEMRCWLPYGAHRLDGAFQVLLNRRYKPVGQASDDFADYERFTHLHVALTPTELAAISARAQGSGFLYNDGCLPWRSRAHATAYLGRLHQLRAILKGH